MTPDTAIELCRNAAMLALMISGPVLLVALAVGLVMGLLFVAANMALQYGASHLPVNTASVVMLTEIVFAASSAVWLGGETLRPQVLLGGALIVSSAALAAWQSWLDS